MPKSRAQQLPACQYGAACTRKGCIYRHPPKPPKASAARAGGAAPSEKTGRVCVAFLAGQCTFGRGCFDDHPPPAEVARLKSQASARAREPKNSARKERESV